MSNAALDKVVDRIQKFLALSKSANEHEAAAAAARAAELMQKYNLDQAQLEVDTGVEQDEAIEDAVVDDSMKSRIPWKSYVANGVAILNGCRSYTGGNGHVHIFGRVSQVQAVSYTYRYLLAEVDRLSDEAWAREGRFTGAAIRRWKNSFRLGCATRIRERLLELKKIKDAELKMEAGDSKALILVQKKDLAVQDAYAALKKTLHIGKAARTQATSRSGWDAGREAGENVQIGGRRAALGAAPGRLRSAS